MATQEAAQALRDNIGKALTFREKNLEVRSAWGSITFEKAAADFRRIFEILSHLSVLPVENLTDPTTAQIQTETIQCASLFGRIDSFNIEQQTPTQIRDTLVTETHGRADQLYTVAGPWIPFLAYQKGDVAKNIESLTKSVGEAKALIEGAKESIKSRQGEIETIITQAREASAAAGAAIFTHDFKNEATRLDGQATTWLWATSILACASLLFAVAAWLLLPIDRTDPMAALQHFGGKLAILIVLFSATLWCGRTYKALRHLSTVNRHRSLSLQTFQAFSHAASDDPTKNAVLMETTHAIFGSVPTGFLDVKGGMEQDLKIIEIAKNLGAK